MSQVEDCYRRHYDAGDVQGLQSEYQHGGWRGTVPSVVYDLDEALFEGWMVMLVPRASRRNQITGGWERVQLGLDWEVTGG